MNTSGEENRSVRNTKRRLMDALMTLLEKKSLNQISVKELVELADVNRGTFYFHYPDVYAMVKDLEDKFLVNLIAMLEKIVHNPQNFMRILLSWFSENSDSCALLMGPNGDSSFSERIIAIVDEKCSKMWQSALSEVDSNKLKLVSSFTLGGVVAVLKAFSCNKIDMNEDKLEKYLNSLIFEGLWPAVNTWERS